ncbi:MAG: hypothetical protein EBQ51_02340 [Verrucomicrobia bacterium]|nr:hypothetical protein [Verrucomicrobiota bacterium]
MRKNSYLDVSIVFGFKLNISSKPFLGGDGRGSGGGSWPAGFPAGGKPPKKTGRLADFPGR